MTRQDKTYQVIRDMIHYDYCGLDIKTEEKDGKVITIFSVSQDEIESWEEITNSEIPLR